MKTLLNTGLISLMAASVQAADNNITISGTVVDAQGKPVSACDVYFNQEKWISADSVHVRCDENGRYRATIAAGHYNSLYICDEQKYAKTALEFWGWNLNLQESQTIDAAFDTIEVYSLSTWASNGGTQSLFASFRPMLLQNASATQKMQLRDHNFAHKNIDGKKIAVLDIAPALSSESIEASVDGQPIKLIDYFWTYEKLESCGYFPKSHDVSNGCYMPMIVAQFQKPSMSAGQHLLKVRLTDDDTQQIGEGITHFVSNKSGYGF